MNLLGGNAEIYEAETTPNSSMFLTNLVIGSNDTLPSFFEMAAESRMIESLRPAFRSLVQTITEHHPRFSSLALFDNEAFAVLHYLIEYHNLFEYDASFSENFYGLKRKGGGSFLSPVHRHLSLCTLVLFPYVKGKLDDAYHHLFVEHVLTDV